MADENASEDETKKKSGGLLSKLIVWGVVFAIGAGSGVAVPLLFMNPGNASTVTGLPEAERMDIPDPGEDIAFIDFEEVVVNLNDNRYSRYLSCTFSLQVAKSQQVKIEKLVDEKSIVLKNWLIAHMRDKQLEDVRGKVGHNLLRREIHDKFNEMLFTDGIERIQDVLFQDFKVQ